jgi:hypothetical protein
LVHARGFFLIGTACQILGNFSVFSLLVRVGVVGHFPGSASS